jgi:hypothetical protein
MSAMMHIWVNCDSSGWEIKGGLSGRQALSGLMEDIISSLIHRRSDCYNEEETCQGDILSRELDEDNEISGAK